MAALCRLFGRKEAWPLIDHGALAALNEIEADADKLVVQAKKAVTVINTLTTHINKWWSANVEPVDWGTISEEQLLEITSEAERLLTRLMAAADELERSTYSAEKSEFWRTRFDIEFAYPVLYTTRTGIENFGKKMERVRGWQKEVFGQV